MERRKLKQAIDVLLADPDFMMDSRIRRLVAEMRTEWIGALNAAALIAAVGDGTTFAKARDLGAWLGLVRDRHRNETAPKRSETSAPFLFW